MFSLYEGSHGRTLAKLKYPNAFLEFLLLWEALPELVRQRASSPIMKRMFFAPDHSLAPPRLASK